MIGNRWQYWHMQGLPRRGFPGQKWSRTADQAKSWGFREVEDMLIPENQLRLETSESVLWCHCGQNPIDRFILPELGNVCASQVHKILGERTFQPHGRGSK